jgi:hypothetical protein
MDTVAMGHSSESLFSDAPPRHLDGTHDPLAGPVGSQRRISLEQLEKTVWTRDFPWSSAMPFRRRADLTAFLHSFGRPGSEPEMRKSQPADERFAES